MDFIAFHFLATKLANIYDTVIYKAKKNEVKFREIIFCQTHNLEVPGSSPGWSTLKIRELRHIRNSFSFLGEIQVKFATKKLIGEIQCNLSK